MQNLLLNASKFSPPGTAIDISATVRDRMLIIQVIDHGRGIGAHALESVFNLFAQEDRPGSSAQGGLGIGLSLCRSLVEMHGGSIAAASEGAGLGATFTVQLPLAAASESSLQSDETPPSHGRTRRVLLVDDNRDAADSMAMLLEMSGHTVVTAYDGMEALHVAARVRPDIALIDLAMPGMDGFTVIHALRAMPALSDTRYVALTGFGQASDRAQTAAAGFHVHLVKPVEVDLLLKIVAGDADAP
jgi:CheY-like chemotaxis protein